MYCLGMKNGCSIRENENKSESERVSVSEGKDESVRYD